MISVTNDGVMSVALQITGDAELVKNLEMFKRSMRIRILRPAFRRGAAVIAREARKRVPVRTGFLTKAIRPISARRDATAMVVMNRGVSNPNELRPVKGTTLRRPYRPAYIARIVETGAYIGSRNARIPAQPFLEPALEAKRQAALDTIAFYMRKEIESPGFIGKALGHS